MAKIIATGIHICNRITVEVTKEDGTLVITAYGFKSPELQKDFDECVANQPPMGGSFYPKHDSMLAAFNVLSNKFFDTLEEITVEGDLGEIPHEDGVIY